MITYLTAHGNSLALILDKAILDLLKITQKTPLRIVTDGRNLIITPIENESKEKKLKKALAKVNRVHGGTLRKLAK